MIPILSYSISWFSAAVIFMSSPVVHIPVPKQFICHKNVRRTTSINRRCINYRQKCESTKGHGTKDNVRRGSYHNHFQAAALTSVYRTDRPSTIFPDCPPTSHCLFYFRSHSRNNPIPATLSVDDGDGGAKNWSYRRTGAAGATICLPHCFMTINISLWISWYLAVIWPSRLQAFGRNK